MGEQLRLYRWHFMETGNPIFAWLAHRISHLISDPETAREADWVHEYFAGTTDRLWSLVIRPPKKRPRNWIAQALGFPARRNVNAFRDALARLKDDQIYLMVRPLSEALADARKPKVTKALQIISEVMGISYSSVTRSYYLRKKLIENGPELKTAKPTAAPSFQ
jgi:hypothetical protein